MLDTATQALTAPLPWWMTAQGLYTSSKSAYALARDTLPLGHTVAPLVESALDATIEGGVALLEAGGVHHPLKPAAQQAEEEEEAEEHVPQLRRETEEDASATPATATEGERQWLANADAYVSELLGAVDREVDGRRRGAAEGLNKAGKTLTDTAQRQKEQVETTVADTMEQVVVTTVAAVNTVVQRVDTLMQQSAGMEPGAVQDFLTEVARSSAERAQVGVRTVAGTVHTVRCKTRASMQSARTSVDTVRANLRRAVANGSDRAASAVKSSAWYEQGSRRVSDVAASFAVYEQAFTDAALVTRDRARVTYERVNDTVRVLYQNLGDNVHVAMTFSKGKLLEMYSFGYPVVRSVPLMDLYLPAPDRCAEIVDLLFSALAERADYMLGRVPVDVEDGDAADDDDADAVHDEPMTKTAAVEDEETEVVAADDDAAFEDAADTTPAPEEEGDVDDAGDAGAFEKDELDDALAAGVATTTDASSIEQI